MAVTDQQKLDFLLKKIGYTKTKTGSVVGTGAISGTPKQPFAEAIPSPLIIANGALWNESGSIPTTPPGSDTTQVKVYLAASSGLRMTADSTSSGQRAYIAYTTYGNASSTRLTNWIDTQFGSAYLIKVYKGDPNSGGVALSAAGSGSNDGWFFDYSAGVLNFNDTSVPSGVTDTNIYIVGYRYIGQTGAPTSGISTFSYLDLTVERNLDVGIQGGISTFRNNIDLNADLDVDGHTNLDNVSIAGVTTTVNDVYFDGATAGRDIQFLRSSNTLKFTDNAIGMFGNAGDMQLYHNGSGSWLDVRNHPFYLRGSHGVQIEGAVGSGLNFITCYDGSVDTQGDRRVEIFNSDIVRLTTTTAGVNVSGTTTTTGLAVTGVSTFTGNIDANGDLDVDGHTNLDNISVAGVSTFTGDATFSGNVSIGGTLTYEDVTNIDSVGVVTARAGLKVTGGTSYFAGAIAAAGAITGTASTATSVTVADVSSDTSCFVLYTTAATGNLQPKSGSNLTFNSVTGQLNATKFVGDGSSLTGISVGIATNAQTVTNGNTLLLDLSKDDHKVTATGTVTISCTGGTEGDSHTVRIVNSGIATVGFSTYFKFPSGATPTIPITSGAISLITFTVHQAGSTGISTQLLSGASVNFS